MVSTLKEFELNFNDQFNYPYLFLNEIEFTMEFKTTILKHTKSKVIFSKIEEELWEIPKSVNQTLMTIKMQELKYQNISYADSVSYRLMCRYQSYYLFQHKEVVNYDYVMRIEPDTHFFCKTKYDLFDYMKRNQLSYGFSITLKEIPETIPTLFDTITKYIKQTKLTPLTYNLCHFWTNFHIIDTNFIKSNTYKKYFKYLEDNNNYFYERWGDAPVISLGLGLFRNASQIHHFSDLGYQHDKFVTCPNNPLIEVGVESRCRCPINFKEFFYDPGSCLPRFKNYEKIEFKKEHVDLLV
ncbi:nucleotide-diphospho-sugar transferase [Neoconidiobolus thromboides FSU 785]|nr:nucleotide-diphospho-sugar transferase [Neoconidiobolus thromboides FSU 785]